MNSQAHGGAGNLSLVDKIYDSYLSNPGRGKGFADEKPESWSKSCAAFGSKQHGVMMDVLRKFQKAGQLVVDPCNGMIVTARACMLLLKHSRFVEIEGVKFCFGAYLGQLCGIICKTGAKGRVEHRS